MAVLFFRSFTFTLLCGIPILGALGTRVSFLLLSVMGVRLFVFLVLLE